jgi:hypothetical protein
MNLRTRLLLGFGYLIVLLMLTAGSAAIGFFQISEAIDQILEENFRSVSAAVEMLEALERQTTVSIDVMLAGTYEAGHFAEHDDQFERHLAIAKGNVTIVGEGDVLLALRRDYDTYREVRDRIVATPGRQPMIDYQRELFPQYSEVKEGVFTLLNMNHQAIISADENARRTALQTAGWLGLLVTISLVSMAFLARLLQQAVLSRFDELTDAAEAILLGEKSRRFEVSGHDELSVVARQLNAALDAQDELEAEMRGRLNQQKQLVLGMLEEIEGPHCLLGLDGHAIAMTGDMPSIRVLDAIHDFVQAHRKAVIAALHDEQVRQELELEFDDLLIHLKLLVAPGYRPVGWLVRTTSRP